MIDSKNETASAPSKDQAKSGEERVDAYIKARIEAIEEAMLLLANDSIKLKRRVDAVEFSRKLSRLEGMR
jgi:hypothetical protein